MPSPLQGTSQRMRSKEPLWQPPAETAQGSSSKLRVRGGGRTDRRKGYCWPRCVVTMMWLLFRWLVCVGGGD